MVMSYIEDNLTDRELSVFLEHIKHCPECYEELEVYYTLYVGLQQLDALEDNCQEQFYGLEKSLQFSKTRILQRQIWNIWIWMIQLIAIGLLFLAVAVEIRRV